MTAIKGDDKTLATVAPSMLAAAQGAAATAGEPACRVNVYRPDSKHWNTSRMRPYVYVDDKQIGMLAVGQSYCLQLEPGSHTVSIRETVSFVIPGFTSGKHEFTVVEGGAPVFMRYTKDIAGIEVVGGRTLVVKEDNRFVIATESQWRARE